MLKQRQSSKAGCLRSGWMRRASRGEACDPRLLAGPLSAHHRRTRRKYVHVGSYAASMPRKVPRRWAGKDLARRSVCMVASGACGARRALVGSLGIRPTFIISPSQAERQASLQHATCKCHVCDAVRVTRFQESSRPTVWCGGLAGCGTVWRHGCRHRAPRDGFTACPASGEDAAHSTHRAFDSSIRSRLNKPTVLGLDCLVPCVLGLGKCRWISCRAAALQTGCRALARPPSQDTPQVRPCRRLRGIHAA
ncbi:hypothetical protein XA1311A_06030 [Xanthomonas arboricola]|nr:hypothetical protein XA1311A_06030 [Xanthomonas arboricola]CAE6708082.1 hypothetical protein XA1311A_06030 [Xanthomonas arboricola]